MEVTSTILITGSKGMVGSALLRALSPHYSHLLFPTRETINWCNQEVVTDYFNQHRPDYVFHLAARVGGIAANQAYPASFIYENTQMHCNVIHAAYQAGVKKILFPGSACTYPKFATQPLSPSAFLDGQVEPTNLAYAVSKMNGILMCQSYAKQYNWRAIVAMPTNAYGVNDNFDPNASHVIPALMKRFHEAKINKQAEVILWGSGKPLREFIYVDDLADALIFLMQQYESTEIINVGTQQEISIAQLATEIASVCNYQGKIILDTTKPDGMMRKCLDSSHLFNLGWKPKVNLRQGLQKMYQHHFVESEMHKVSDF